MFLTTSVAYSLGHNLYTPDAIESAEQDPEDRPWSAFVYGSMGMVTLNDESLDEYEIALGVVGPLALGEPVQKAVPGSSPDRKKDTSSGR